ncbi:MAG: hypothetical protein ACUVXF_05075 [Desulfobaccales bacterium]
MPAHLPPTLSESHKNRVRITLTLVDEALTTFEAWARGREVRAVFYQETNNLDPDCREAMLADIAAIRMIMKEIRDHLVLESRPLDVAKTIRGHCYLLWVDVMEITGKYLRGFGDPPPDVMEFLDPKAHQILRLLDHMKMMLTEPQR